MMPFGRQTKERVSIVFDGANFHHIVLKKLGIDESLFLFDNFVSFLANGRDISPKGKRFYTGTVREILGNERSKSAMSKQTTLLTKLHNSGWEIRTSKLRTRTETIIIDDRVYNYRDILKRGIKKIEIQRTREKGIDVKIATDILVGAVDNKYDTIIVVSSDTDLAPAMDWVRKRSKKKVEYIGFSLLDPNPIDPEKPNNTTPSKTLFKYSDIQRVFAASDLKQFVQGKLTT